MLYLCLAVLFASATADKLFDAPFPELSDKELSREPRLLFNTSFFENATNAALISGAFLFVGLNTAFALAFLDKPRESQGYSSSQESSESGYKQQRGHYYNRYRR